MIDRGDVEIEILESRATKSNLYCGVSCRGKSSLSVCLPDF